MGVGEQPPPHLLSGGGLGPGACDAVAAVVGEQLRKNLPVLARGVQEVSAAPVNLSHTRRYHTKKNGGIYILLPKFKIEH